MSINDEFLTSQEVIMKPSPLVRDGAMHNNDLQKVNRKASSSDFQTEVLRAYPKDNHVFRKSSKMGLLASGRK
jgi:hypothetical protein